MERNIVSNRMREVLNTLCLSKSAQRLFPETETEKSLNLYPNPASSEITVDIQSMDFDQWVIYSIDGRMVAEGKVDSEAPLSISTAEFESGHYMLRLSGKDPTRSVTFIVQKPNR